MLKLGGGGGWGPLQGGGGGSRGVVGRGGERDGGDSGSNFALTTGANPLVLAAPPPPDPRAGRCPQGTVGVDSGLELGRIKLSNNTS